MKVLVLASLLLLSATQARATTQTFNIFFDFATNTGGTSVGQYTVTDGFVASFDAVIGRSTFHGGFGPDPFDNIASQFFNGSGAYEGARPIDFSTLTMTEWLFSDIFETKWVHEYRVHTPSAFDPSGPYRAELVSAAVPELSPAWLLFIGAALISASRYARRR